MGLRVGHVVLDVVDLPVVQAFWCAALDVVPVDEDEAGVALPLPGGLTLDLLRVPDRPRAPGQERDKNRLHLDLRPTKAGTQEQEVARLLGLGAVRVDVGQGDDATWVVLADPEGNEFCVLRDQTTA